MNLSNKYELDTPCLTLDTDTLDVNLQKMQAMASRAGKSLRPHAKTHKCSSLARRQIETGACGICVAKVSEAQAMAKAGLAGILVTGPVATAKKIARLVDALAISPSLMTVVDHRDSIDLLDAALRQKGLLMDVLLDMDIGLHRTGVQAADALNLAQHILSCSALRLRGVQAYAGHVQHIQGYEARKAASQENLQEAVAVFAQLQAAVDTCTILSTSGTGTFDIDMQVPEITELQVGSYVCMDMEYLAIASARNATRFTSFDAPLRLLTTVISSNQKGFVTVDAGLKALYRDGAVPRVIGADHDGLVYDWFGDEYGKITCADSGRLPALGSVLELVVSHCDPTINLFDRFHLVKGTEVVGVWPIDLRGCSQ